MVASFWRASASAGSRSAQAADLCTSPNPAYVPGSKGLPVKLRRTVQVRSRPVPSPLSSGRKPRFERVAYCLQPRSCSVDNTGSDTHGLALIIPVAALTVSLPPLSYRYGYHMVLHKKGTELYNGVRELVSVHLQSQEKMLKEAIPQVRCLMLARAKIVWRRQ